MQYTLEFERRVAKDLRSIPARDRTAIETAIARLMDNPRPVGATKVKNTQDWKIRVGVYRVRYRIEDDRLRILVVRIGHRREVYR